MWGIASVLRGIPSVLWRLFSTVGDNISTVGDSFSTVESIQYIGGYHQYMQGDNISTVEDIQYSGRRILISACLVINDEKISTSFCIAIRNFHSEVFRKFKQISCLLVAGLVYSRSNLVSK